MFDVNKIRKDFPILSQKVNNTPLIYLDNAATTQLPQCVIDSIVEHYQKENSNVHRGIHYLSDISTERFEHAREVVRDFIGAQDPSEIVFTSGATDSINLVAAGLIHIIKSGDHILVSELEHHSNLLPWQKLCKHTGAVLDIIPCPDGEADMETFEKLLKKKPKITAVTHVSNLTGTVMPIKKMTELAHKHGSLMLIDGAQGIRNEYTNVSDIDCDFYCFSGHKIMAPSGIGVLYGKTDSLQKIDPPKTGGGMVDIVTKYDHTSGPLPNRLEAGTPNYSGAIALAEALNYIIKTGRKDIISYERMLTEKAVSLLSSINGIRILGTPCERSGIVSFLIDGLHPYDAASILDKFGVALRSGTHCAQPALAVFGIDNALRLSTAFYNTEEELVQTKQAIIKTISLFRQWQSS